MILKALSEDSSESFVQWILHCFSADDLRVRAVSEDVIPIAKPKFTNKQQLITPSIRVPLQAGGTKTLRFPSRSGGNLKEGGNCEL